MMQKDIIVVGGGIAGLTAALSLAHSGQAVLLLEKNESLWRADEYFFQGRFSLRSRCTSIG